MVYSIAYTTTFDAQDVHNWSGTPYYMSKNLAQHGTDIQYIGSLKRKLPPFFKLKQFYKKYFSGQRESPRFNVHAAKQYSLSVEKQLRGSSAQAILSPLINPVAYLDCKQPIVLWTDALYAALLGFYPPFSLHSASSIQQGNEITRECLSRCRLALFSSDWAARSALELYGTSKEKIKVMPFGANIDHYPNFSEVKEIISQRASSKIKLLFLAKSWERKGGDIVLAVANALHQAGHAVELNIVGYIPPEIPQHAPYINCLGYISKHTPDGRKRISDLLASTHFLFVPSRAEAYGIVFCEANAFGVPCLTTYVGGIGSVVKDNINGMTFGLDASVQTYADYITNLMHDKQRYDALSLSAYQEYETRLNWKSATKQVKMLIDSII
jgi:glycosyltransferase involved in cell wall biosynthesis